MGTRTNPDMVAYFPRIAAFDSFVGDVVYNHHTLMRVNTQLSWLHTSNKGEQQWLGW